MSSLICSNCDWYKDNYCTNSDSMFIIIKTGGTNTCSKYYPALSVITETVNHPNHYNVGGIEVIDFIESWNLGFSLGNAIKYIARAPYKNDELEDLKKARWYIDREIQRLEKDTK